MKLVETIRRRTDEESATEFAAMAKFIMANGRKFSQAAMRADDGRLEHLRGFGLSMKGIEILKHVAEGKLSRLELQQKAAQNPSTLAGSSLQDVGAIVSGFINSLSSAGAFDAMLPDMAVIPMQPGGSVGAITVGATGYQINEGGVKPITKLSVSGVATNVTKVHTALVITQELARTPLLAARQLIQRELRNGLAIATDAAFISLITAGVIPASSFGSTGANARSDIEWLLRQVGLKQTSKPYLITTSAICGTLSQLNNSGQACFPDLGPQGGSISGIPVLVSDAVSLGFLILVDASQIAASGGDVVLEQLDEAIIQLDDSPDSPQTGSTNYTSMWQSNLTGIRVERFLIANKLTSKAVAIINNPNSYVTGSGSP